MILPSGIEELIDFFNFASWIFYGLTMVATLICKFTYRNADRAINVRRERGSTSDNADSP
jgi:hypothetical protein